MKVLVLVKIVPKGNNMLTNQIDSAVMRDNVESVISPGDLKALEAALKLKESGACDSLTVICMGVRSKSDLLKETLALGADRAILLSDMNFAGADTLATAYTLSKAIENLRDIDLIFCGAQSTDGETGQVGPSVASIIGIPFITNAQKIEAANDYSVLVTRQGDYGKENVEMRLPGLITVSRNSEIPRLPSLANLIKAERSQIEVWTSEDIKADINQCGKKGSRTAIKKTSYAEYVTKCEIVSGDTCKNVSVLVEKVFKKYRNCFK